MGKRKAQQDAELEEDVDIETESPTKHKKQKKHKKHKKKSRHSISEDVDVLELETSPKPAIKLKIKLGGQTFATKSIDSSSIAPAPEDSQLLPEAGEAKPKKKEGDTSDEEQEWLDALEKGTLDDYGGVKKSKDPKLLTARQRALIHGPSEEQLEQLPSGYKQVELTEEQLQRRQQRANKRRQQALEKREKAKKQTVDRLLKKQEAKLKGSKNKGPKTLGVPHVRYLQTQTGVSLSLPSSIPFPMTPQTHKEPTAVTKCCICESNNKKYSCSKTGKPLCSLQCYKTNKESNLSAFQALKT